MMPTTCYLGFPFPAIRPGLEHECVAVTRLPFKPRYLAFSYAADVATLTNLRVGQNQQWPRESAVPISMFAGIAGHNELERARVDELMLELARHAREGICRGRSITVWRSYSHDAELSVSPCHAGYAMGLTVRWPDAIEPVPFACVAIGWGLDA